MAIAKAYKACRLKGQAWKPAWKPVFGLKATLTKLKVYLSFVILFGNVLATRKLYCSFWLLSSETLNYRLET